ncbi:EamA family transporter RarD [Oscillibacter ruminantium]|jgi:chloramphenicol-sensitive protein RarD
MPKVMNTGAFYVAACYAAWGVLPLFWKSLGSVNSVYVLASRIVWSLVMTLLMLTARREWGSVRTVLQNRWEWARLAVGGVLITVNWGVYIWAVNSAHIIDASLAYYIMNPMTVLLGTLLFREKLTKLQWFATGLTVTGIAIAAVRLQVFPWIALVIGGSFALYSAVKKKVTVDANVSIFFETATVTPLALIWIITAEMQGAGAGGILHGAQWLLLPLSGLVTTIPLMLFAVGIKTTSMSMSGVLMYINPTLQLLLGVLLYHEEFTVTHGILFGFVWTSLTLFLISDRRKQKKTAKENEACA